jgi:hypothetical protein
MWEEVKALASTKPRRKILPLSRAHREITKRVQQLRHHTYSMSYYGEPPTKREIQNVTVKTHGKVNGAHTRAVWDTGSTSTVVSAAMARKCQQT